MIPLSTRIGAGVQTFRIKDFERLFTIVKDFGPDHKHTIASRKLVKLEDEGIYYALIGIPYKDIEEFVIRISSRFWRIDWNKIAAIADECRWQGPELDFRYINDPLIDLSGPWRK